MIKKAEEMVSIRYREREGLDLELELELELLLELLLDERLLWVEDLPELLEDLEPLDR